MSALNNISELAINMKMYQHFGGYGASTTYGLLILLDRLGVSRDITPRGVYSFIDRMVGKGILSGSVEPNI
jgi:hypothetical protein